MVLLCVWLLQTAHRHEYVLDESSLLTLLSLIMCCICTGGILRNMTINSLNILKKTKKGKFLIPPWRCPWPCAAAPRCDGTRRCSCWDSGRPRHSTPSSLGGASEPNGHWAAGSSLRRPALLGPDAAAAAASCCVPQRSTDAGSAAAPSVCRETTTAALASTCCTTFPPSVAPATGGINTFQSKMYFSFIAAVMKTHNDVYNV